MTTHSLFSETVQFGKVVLPVFGGRVRGGVNNDFDVRVFREIVQGWLTIQILRDLQKLERNQMLTFNKRTAGGGLSGRVRRRVGSDAVPAG